MEWYSNLFPRTYKMHIKTTQSCRPFEACMLKCEPIYAYNSQEGYFTRAVCDEMGAAISYISRVSTGVAAVSLFFTHDLLTC